MCLDLSLAACPAERKDEVHHREFHKDEGGAGRHADTHPGLLPEYPSVQVSIKGHCAAWLRVLQISLVATYVRA